MLEWVLHSKKWHYSQTQTAYTVVDRSESALLEGNFTISDLEQIIAKMREVQKDERTSSVD